MPFTGWKESLQTTESGLEAILETRLTVFLLTMVTNSPQWIEIMTRPRSAAPAHQLMVEVGGFTGSIRI